MTEAEAAAAKAAQCPVTINLTPHDAAEAMGIVFSHTFAAAVQRHKSKEQWQTQETN